MAIHQSDAATVVTGEDTTNLLHLIQVKHALKIELAGMKVGRGSLVNLCNQLGYSKKRTKAGCLKDVEALIGKVKKTRDASQDTDTRTRPTA